MNDPYVVYFVILALAVTVALIWRAYGSWQLGRLAQGMTRKFLYSLVAVQLSTALVQLFWVILVLSPQFIPSEWARWPYYRLALTVLWTVTQLGIVGATYYSWKTLSATDSKPMAPKE